MVSKSDFIDDVSLLPGLDTVAIRKSIDYIERKAREFIDLYYEQANLFSGFIGILGAKALDSVSAYEKHRHRDTAQQRFPDLRRRGSGDKPRPEESLESKASIRPWAIQSHYNHRGWYIVWRYLVDPTESLEPGRPVLIWRVDVVFLNEKDWKYEGSPAGNAGGGRTHTFAVKKPSQTLKGKAVYKRKDVVIRRQKPIPANGGEPA